MDQDSGTATTIGRRLGLFPRISVTARVNAALAEEGVRERVFPAYPRTQVQPIPTPRWAGTGGEEER